MITCDCTAITATGDTVRTSIGTITLPPNINQVVAVGVYANAGAAMTTAESVSGIFEVEFTGKDVTPAKFPLDSISCLTEGTVALKTTQWPVGWTGVGSQTMTFYVTMDMAQTGALTARGFAVLDKTVK